MSRILLFLAFALTATVAFAQNGSISGTVTDEKTKEPIIGANVIIQGTQVGNATDLEGKFLIANLKPGTYNLAISFITYKTHLIQDIIVEPGKVVNIQAALLEDAGTELAEVVIKGTREINNDMSLVNAIKESKLVVSGISAEQITKLPDRDAAQVMQRVSGVTISDNRFVLVRGIPERYNQVMINGIIGPSTEIDRRSFSFDLIPAGAIDQLLVYKSGSAELPGDFAGGLVKIVTKKPTDERFIQVGASAGYRTNTTGENYYQSKGSSTDWLGFDNGFRDLPAGFPSRQALDASATNSTLRERAGKSLTNNFDYTTRQAPIDMGFNISTSQPFTIGNLNVNNLTVIGYSNTYQHTTADFNRYNSFTATSAEPTFTYVDDYTGNSVRVNALSNWFFDISDRFKIEFKNLFVQLGENETILRSGTHFYQGPNYDRQNYAMHYLSRTIYSGQLEGTHTFAGETASLNWVFGYNDLTRNEPDYRRFRTFRDKMYQDTEEPFIMQLPAGGNIFETGRFWSELKDQGYSNGLNFEKKFGNKDEKRIPVIRAGYYVEYKTRSFNARTINYLYPSGAGFDPAVGEELIRLPLSDIFAPENIKKSNGFVIEDATSPEDSYEGNNLLTAGYVGASIPVGKFDISPGFRGEYNVMKLTALRTSGGAIDVDNPVFAPLPSLNIAYNLTDRSLARIAYSRTVNRPEFRELAPFLYYQFEMEASLYGTPTLKTAFINNIDLRWEMYPNAGEMISIGAFYKDFKDPIEMYLQVTSDNPQLYYGNAEKAYSYGAEVEFRKNLASLGVSKFLRNTSVNVNASWIQSEVNVGSSQGNLQEKRPLQGQSPYIVNAGLYYQDEESGFTANVAYNVFGPRIFSVGDVNFPTWWELPRQSLDLQVGKKWMQNRFETRLNVQNLLNAAYRIYQDNDLNNKIEDQEAQIRRYQTGTLFTVGLSYKLDMN
ncbi:outer membrane beta-barrel protein [Chryseolinea sp. T2]|uniref:TonB-dependent receptor n=1 Tax=Chryseolinea sp. T2 TaxID=3129255 RepID=UPI00307827B6